MPEIVYNSARLNDKITGRMGKANASFGKFQEKFRKIILCPSELNAKFIEFLYTKKRYSVETRIKRVYDYTICHIK